MEATSLLTTTTTYFPYPSSTPSSSHFKKPHFFSFFFLNSNSPGKCRILNINPQTTRFPLSLPPTSLLRTSAAAVAGEFMDEKSTEHSDSSSSSSKHTLLPKIDKSGRFCSPRAARELALSIIYAACLEGSDPVRLFEKRMNVRREPGYEFDKTLLTEYNHMSFGGPPVSTDTVEEADELMRDDGKMSEIEAEVLSAPPKLVYSKLILRFTRKLLVAVVESWDDHVLVIDKVAPQNWKNEPAGRILELSILHLAMSDIAVLGTRHQIVINEAVDLAKRFCDGAAPRVINGCLRTFVKDVEVIGMPQAVPAKKRVSVAAVV